MLPQPRAWSTKPTAGKKRASIQPSLFRRGEFQRPFSLKMLLLQRKGGASVYNRCWERKLLIVMVIAMSPSFY